MLAKSKRTYLKVRFRQFHPHVKIKTISRNIAQSERKINPQLY